MTRCTACALAGLAACAHLAVALPLGLGVGLGVGLATRTAKGSIKAALAGLAGGGLAGALYPVALSLALPTTATDALLPDEAVARLLWLGLLSGLIGLMVPVAWKRRTASWISSHSCSWAATRRSIKLAPTEKLVA